MKKTTEQDDMRPFLQDTFSDFEVQADTEVWQNIQQELGKKERKVIPLWWTYGAAASAMLILGIALFWNDPIQEQATYQPLASGLSLEESPSPEHSSESPNIDVTNKVVQRTNSEATKIPAITNSGKEQSAIGTTKQVSQPENTSVAAVTKKGVKSDAPASLQEAESTTEHVVANTTSPVRQQAEHIEQKDETLSEVRITLSDNSPASAIEKTMGNSMDQEQLASGKVTDSLNNNETLTKSGTTANKHSEAEMDSFAAIAALQLDLGMPVDEEKEYETQWLLAANMQSSRDNSEQIINYGLVNDEGFKDVENSNLTTVSELDRPNATFEERSYLPPLKVSVTVNYRFRPKWSIETGLSYAVLASTRNSTETSAFSIEQRDFLYYLGIPMLINYEWYTRAKFAAFLTSGLTIEKGLTQVTKTSIEEKEGLNETSRNGIKGVKYSAFLGLGAEYRPYSLIGIYLQPGITSYAATSPQPFDIGGSNSTGVKPELRFGLRFHLN
jgi:hypothetical protein